MSWLNQFSLVMRSSVTTLREKIEDPERMLHQLLIDMENKLDHVQHRVAEAMADEIQLRDRRSREQDAVDTWQRRAGESMERSDEVSAKAAIAQKLVCQGRADQYAADHAKQQTAVETLRRGVEELKDKIQQAKRKKTLLAARMAQATSTVAINDALQRTQNKSEFAHFARLEEKVDRQEAVTQAWDQIQGNDPDADELKRQFETQERDRQIDAELQRLKASLQK